MLSDLRESGAIEQDADLVLFIYRPEYYQIDQDENGNSLEGVAEIIIAKHRNGALGSARLKFIGKYAKFADDDSSYESTPDFISTETKILPSRMNQSDSDNNPF